ELRRRLLRISAALFALTWHLAIDKGDQFAAMRTLFALQTIRRLRDDDLLLLHGLRAFAIHFHRHIIRCRHIQLKAVATQLGMHIADAVLVRVFALLHLADVA